SLLAVLSLTRRALVQGRVHSHSNQTLRDRAAGDRHMAAGTAVASIPRLARPARIRGDAPWIRSIEHRRPAVPDSPAQSSVAGHWIPERPARGGRIELRIEVRVAILDDTRPAAHEQSRVLRVRVPT